jgi:hypothetical protein
MATLKTAERNLIIGSIGFLKNNAPAPQVPMPGRVFL